MSEFSDILTGRLKLKRLTPNIVDKTATIASVTINRQPTQACRLAVEVEGATVATGSVAIAGSTTETLSFTANSVGVSTKDFSSISGITIAGISNGFITVRAVSKMGQPVNQEREVEASLPVRFYAINGKIRMIAAGQEKVAKYKFMCDYNKDVQENDIIYGISQVAGLTRGMVSFVENIFDLDGVTHHIEAEVIPA